MESSAQLSPAPWAYSPALRFLSEYDQNLYQSIWDVVQSMEWHVHWPRTSMSFRDCTDSVQDELMNILRHCLDDIASQFSSPAVPAHCEAVLDFMCFRGSQGQQLSQSPSVLGESAIVDQIAQIWDIVMNRAILSSQGEFFAAFFQKHTCADWFARIRRESCVLRNEILRTEWDSRDGLLSLAVPRPQLPLTSGHYLGIMTQEGNGEWYKLYVGQADKIRNRIRHHETDHVGLTSPLFYWAWAKEGRKVSWVLLSQVESMPDESPEDRSRWLSLVEMFYCLVFKSLQTKDLHNLLGPSTTPELGLNMRSPLLQGRIIRGPDSGFGAVMSSQDPETREYGIAHMDTMREKAVAANEAKDYVNSSAAIVAAKGNNLIRMWLEGDPERVVIHCNNCKSKDSEKVDSNPRFHKVTGQYIADQSRCIGPCQPTPSMLKKRLTHRVTYHSPVNLAPDAWITKRQIYKASQTNAVNTAEEGPSASSIASPDASPAGLSSVSSSDSSGALPGSSSVQEGVV